MQLIHSWSSEVAAARVSPKTSCVAVLCGEESQQTFSTSDAACAAETEAAVSIWLSLVRALSACRQLQIVFKTVYEPAGASITVFPDNSHGGVTTAEVGINLSDPVFRGIYHGKQAHDDDLEDIIQRARDVGCVKFMVTGSSLKESKHAVSLAEQFPGECFATIGVHPCSTQDFDKYPGGPDKLLEALKELAVQAKTNGHAVAFGEFGLDWDRLFLSPKDTQLKYFAAQLDIAVELQLPLFLHSRSCSDDFERLLKPRLDQLPKRGLVHSFTGTVDEMTKLVEMGFDIGVNGCSMKTEENLEVVKQVPLDRLQIETDGPWCEMRPSHASSKFLTDGPAVPKAVKKEKFQRGLMIKGRNEPATICQVAHVIAGVKGIAVREVCEAAWRNSVGMFGLGERTDVES